MKKSRENSVLKIKAWLISAWTAKSAKSEWKGELYKRSITGEAMRQNNNVIFSAAPLQK